MSCYIFHLKRTLKCVKEPDILSQTDVKPVQNAITSGDRHIFIALCELLGPNTLELYFLMLFNEMDLELLSWIYSIFRTGKHCRVTWVQSELLGVMGDLAIAHWARGHEYCVSVHEAAKFGHLELVKYLYEAGGDQDFSVAAMGAAATNGYLDIVQFCSCARIAPW